MNSFGNLLSSLQTNFDAMAVVGILFGAAAILGIFFGASLVGLISAIRRRRLLGKFLDEQKQLQVSLQNSQSNAIRLRADHDKLQAKYNGVDGVIKRQEKRIEAITTKHAVAASSAEKLAQKLKEVQSANKQAIDAKVPPTLIKRVSSDSESSPNSFENGIIPDDQVIPILSEAELTANVEAYDLSDLEDLVGQDN